MPPWEGSSQREVMAFCWVKNRTPSAPWALVSPNRDVLPAAERERRDRDRDGHVDADHPDLDLVLEAAGRAAVVREDRGPVAERAVVDQRDALLVGGDADDREDRPEDLLRVHLRRRRHVVDEGRAEPEPVRVAVDARCRGRRRRPSRRPRRRRRCRTRPCRGAPSSPAGPCRSSRRPSPIRSVAARSCDLGDQLVRDGLDRDDDRDRHAPLTRGPEAGVDRGVGDEVEVRVGQHEHVVLRPAERLDALAVLRRRSRRRTARSASNRRTRSTRTSGCVEEPVDGDLVTVAAP